MNLLSINADAKTRKGDAKRDTCGFVVTSNLVQIGAAA